MTVWSDIKKLTACQKRSLVTEKREEERMTGTDENQTMMPASIRGVEIRYSTGFAPICSAYGVASRF